MKVTSLRYLDAKFHHPIVWGHHPLIGAKAFACVQNSVADKRYRIAFCAANSSECNATAFRIALIALQNNAWVIALSSAHLPDVWKRSKAGLLRIKISCSRTVPVLNKKPSWCWDSQPSVGIFGNFFNFPQQHSNMVRLYRIPSCITHRPVAICRISWRWEEKKFRKSTLTVQVQSHVTQKLGQISKIRPDQI